MSEDLFGVAVTDDRRYPHGVPCWVDVTQRDLAEAGRFYGGLFGWQLTDVMPAGAPGAYLVATLDGHDVGAVSPLEEPDAADRARGPAWRTYVAVDDVDATAAAVPQAGGRVVVAPHDAGPGGRTATAVDPAGAELHLWQARRRLGAQLVNVPDTWNFSDLVTPDAALVLPFYAALFGWATEAGQGAGMIRRPGYGDHLAATVDPHIHERQRHAPVGFADVVAGLTVAAEACWRVRFAVSDRDASISRAQRLGATVDSVSETPWTREAALRDPQGARFTVSQFTPQSG
jgi:predicted enzyme related to lactoylglutathione lyase